MSLVDRIRQSLEGPLAAASAFLDSRAPRERLLIYAAGATTVILVLWLGLWEPLQESLGGTDRKIAVARRDIAEIERLLGRHATLKRRVDSLEKRAGAASSRTSLFAELESITVPILGRERVSSMNPSTRSVGDELQEELVEMRLEGVPSRELVKLLYEIEGGRRPMYVERLAFKRRYKDRAQLDATLVVARLRPR